MDRATFERLREAPVHPFIFPSTALAAAVAPVAPMWGPSGINNHTRAANHGANQIKPHGKQFSDLPPEIRRIIWTLVAEGRIVIVDHNFSRGARVTRANVTETYPILMGVNYETRQLTERLRYTSLFGRAPRIEQGRWRLKLNLNQQAINLCIDLMPFTVIGTELRAGTKTTLRVQKYLNANPRKSSQYRTFAKLHQPFIGPEIAFFNVNKDIIYLRRTPTRYNGFQKFRVGLWSPYRTNTARRIKTLALELDSLTPLRAPLNPPDFQCYWSNYGNFASFRVLETLHLVLLADQEVINVTLDKTGTLTPKQWTFSLDQNAQLFKKEMGDSWLGVTWNVTLAARKYRSVYQLARTWRINNHAWEHQKRLAFAAEVNVSERAREWLDIDRVFQYTGAMKRYKLVVVPGSDGKTYYGVSRS